MRTNCILLIFPLLTSTLQSVATATTDPELRTILQKHWEAIGGNNWNKVESIRLNGTIERNGQVVDICIVKKRPNQIRATITLPIPGSEGEELQVIRAHDGKTAWTATRIAGTPEMIKGELTPEADAELLADAGVLPPLIKLWREGAELELLDPKTINGESVLTIHANSETLASDDTFYLSSENYLLLAHDSHDLANGTTRTTLADYIKDSGIYLPTRNIIDSAETGRSVMTTESIEVGVGIYSGYFCIEPSLETMLSK